MNMHILNTYEISKSYNGPDPKQKDYTSQIHILSDPLQFTSLGPQVLGSLFYSCPECHARTANPSRPGKGRQGRRIKTQNTSKNKNNNKIATSRKAVSNADREGRLDSHTISLWRDNWTLRKNLSYIYLDRMSYVELVSRLNEKSMNFIA